MTNQIIFVGAGPIGLWTALQLKLQRLDFEIIFQEKYTRYKRTHTLKLEHTSFAGCIYDEKGIIKNIVAKLKKNPHIRTDSFEGELSQLARSLGISIEYKSIKNIEQDILKEYPNADMIIGADGVRSIVREQIFGLDNVERTPLAYAAQIKYVVKDDALKSDSYFQAYPLLKQSDFLSFTSVGQKKEGITPVTIQHIIDKQTYDAIKYIGFANAINIFSVDIATQLPPKLLHAVKAQIGFRLAGDEDIILDSANLTVTELPQQRCKNTIKFQNGRFYGLIGDAALALSYFKGMNSGLPLATQFSKSIVKDWDKIKAQDQSALYDYEKHYAIYANDALNTGHQTNASIQFLNSTVRTIARSPFQFIYFTNQEIVEYQREFDILHQVNQFFNDIHGVEADRSLVPISVQDLKNILKTHIEPGLDILRKKTLALAQDRQNNTELSVMLSKLASINTTHMNIYEKAYYVLAMSKTNELIQSRTNEKYDEYCKLNEQIKSVRADFYQILSSILEAIAGIVVLGLGITSLVCSAGMTAPTSVPAVIVGCLLTGHGFFQLSKNIRGSNEMSRVVNAIGDHVKMVTFD